ncbi:MAG: hypothetical protein WA058_02575 [Minisyncoccia bacterium]
MPDIKLPFGHLKSDHIPPPSVYVPPPAGTVAIFQQLPQEFAAD